MGKKKKSASQQATMTLTDLDQIRVLADPLRVRMLEALCLEPRTTKQVAETLGEKPTKLYHHVDALEKVGLIRLVRTKRNRGTLEKYYQSVARSFKAAPTLFDAGGKADAAVVEPIVEMVGQLMERTKGELLSLAESADDLEELEDTALVTFAAVHASEEEVKEIRSKLEKLLKELGTDDERPPEGAREFRLMLAYYPLDR